MTFELCQNHNPPFHAGLQGLLEQIAFVQHYSLRYVQKVEKNKGQDTHIMWDYMGVTESRGQDYSGEYAQEKRLYLCKPEGIPMLSLHPLFVVNEKRLYVLKYHDEVDKSEKHAAYSDCGSGKDFEPGRMDSYSLSKLFDDKYNKLPYQEEELPIQPTEDGLPVEENLPTPSLRSALADLLAMLNEEGKQALEIALGEALRIGRFWLGIEFLLMALSKQEGCALPDLLRQIELDAGEWRGRLRGLAGVVTRDDWRKADVFALGHEALPRLQEADPLKLAAEFETAAQPTPVVTPRMMAVLREASHLAGAGKIGHVELLLGALKHPQCPPVNFLMGKAEMAGLNSRQVSDYVRQRAGSPDVAEDDEDEQPQGKPPQDEQPQDNQEGTPDKPVD